MITNSERKKAILIFPSLQQHAGNISHLKKYSFNKDDLIHLYQLESSVLFQNSKTKTKFKTF